MDALPKGGGSSSSSRWRGSAYPYLSILLYVDAAAAIDVLSVAMDSPEAIFRGTGGETSPSPVSPGSPATAAAAAIGGSFGASGTPQQSRGQPYSRGSSSSAAGGGAGGGRDGPRAAGGSSERKALGGGVWGRRLGRGRARAAVVGEVGGGGGGGGGEARGGGGEWQTAGAGWRVVGGADVEDVCPSRSAIIEVRAPIFIYIYTVCGVFIVWVLKKRD